MLISKLVCIMACLMMLAQAYAVRKAVGTWIYPACLYGLFWFAFSFFPVVLVPGSYSSPYALLYVLASCVAVSLGGIGLGFSRQYQSVAGFEESDRALFGSTVSKLIFVFCIGAALLCLVIDASIQGISFGALVSDFFATSNSYMVLRYTDGLVANIFGQLATVLNYLACFIGGLIYWSLGAKGARLQKAVVIFATFVPSIFVLVVQAAKGTIFLALGIFVAGILIGRVRARQDLPINAGTLMIGLRYSALLLPLLVISFYSRGLYEAQSIEEINFSLRRYFTSYAFGHIYAFSDWFEFFVGVGGTQYYRIEDSSYGFYTFMSLFRTFGDERYLPPGVYDEYFSDGLFVTTNIYTAFRGLITDFSLTGSLVVTAVISSIVHISYKRLANAPRFALSAGVFVLFCAFLVSSYIISVLIWNSLYVLFFGIVVFLVGTRLLRGAHLTTIKT
jgi:oligosaccharide repeat unit polymerase